MELSNRIQTLQFRHSDIDKFNIAVTYHDIVDFNNDGIDELLITGAETQPNTPEEYDPTKINIFGWADGVFANLTESLLPGQSSRIEGTGDVAIGDFNGDSLTDFFTTAGTDMTHTVNAYQFLNTGQTFVKSTVGSGDWAHGSAVYDLNDDGYDDVIPAGWLGTQPVLMGGPSGLSVDESNWVAYGADVAVADFLGDGSVTAIKVDAADGNYGLNDTQLVELVIGDSVSSKPLSILPTPRLEGYDIGMPANQSNSHDIRVVAYDFSGDGLSDALIFSRGWFDGQEWINRSEIQFLENTGSGIFVDVTEERLIGYDTSSVVTYDPVFRDFNSDGRIDIFNSYREFRNSPNSTSILLQNQDGTFSDSHRDLFSSKIEKGDMASMLLGPGGQIFFVVESRLNQSHQNGGVANLDLYSVSFPEREASEVLRDTSGDDRIYGLGGDDTIYVSSGEDLIDGGLGIDRVVFPSEQVPIQLTDIGYVVGNATLMNVERKEFSDVSLAFDLDGSAGLTAKTLAAVIGEEGLSNKEYVGIGLQLFDAGQSLAAVCELALTAVGATTNEDVVNLLYTNLYGEVPTAEVAQPFIDTLNNGGLTKGSLAAAAAELADDLGVIDLVGLAETGIEYI